MIARVRIEGVLDKDPREFTNKDDEQCVELFLWHLPGYSEGFDGAVSHKFRVLATGYLGQRCLGGDQEGARALHREDLVVVSGEIHFKVIRFHQPRRATSRPVRMKYPVHTIYVECGDESGDDILYQGRLSLAGAGLYVLGDEEEAIFA